jgi:metallo-beta-lactamase family protein
VEQISGFSAHADRDELMKWLSGLNKPPRHLFITHGEVEAANAFADFVREKKGWNLSVPTYQEEVVLD